MRNLKYSIVAIVLALSVAGCTAENETVVPMNQHRESADVPKHSEEYQTLLDSSLERPQSLDELWSGYAETKDPEFVLKIISVLDWDDNVRRRLETWLNDSPESEIKDYEKQMADWSFPIDYQGKTIAGPIDLDLHVALLAKSGELKFEELPVLMPRDELIQLAMKSAALWSLMSVSKQDAMVAEICVQQSLVAGGPARLHLAKAATETTGK